MQNWFGPKVIIPGMTNDVQRVYDMLNPKPKELEGYDVENRRFVKQVFMEVKVYNYHSNFNPLQRRRSWSLELQ